MKYVVTIVERVVNEVTVEASDPDTAMDKAHEAYINGVDVDYAIDIGIETMDVSEVREDYLQEAGEEEVRRQSRPDDVT